MDQKIAERMASALENIVEKLASIETKLEELSYEVQSQGNMICETLAPSVQECDN